MQSPSPVAAASPAPIAHYENFPVASFLCPAHLRAPIAAIYHFARTADDIADEGDASADQRLVDLAAYRTDLHAAAEGSPTSTRWPQVFAPLAATIRQHQLPVQLLDDLIDAFVQDTRKTAEGSGYANDAELLDYCRRSANPVGRLLLHLYGVNDAQALQRSDAICSALQLINFWQDLSVDLPRGRYYLPADALAQWGLSQADLQTAVRTGQQPQNATQLIAALAHSARALMLFGSKLVHQVPGRAGWELRLVVQGGLRILDRMAALNYATLTQRPTLRKWDYVVMVWRALWM
ncbi:MAG: squalene synthase HpnC [Burkholderiales bacterium PBB3]|nr:MAG: squalene synthase HpnC [Burkholderiales bacterium PBB3]